MKHFLLSLRSFKRFAASLILIIAIDPAFATDYYWVGNSGNWSDVSHWATSSGGASFHVAAPTSADDVYFDANSFSSPAQTVTVNTTASCNSMIWTGTTNSPTLALTNDLSLAGSFTLIAGMSVSGSGTFRFTSAGTGNTLTSAGRSLPNLSFEGSSDWTLQDNLAVISTVTLDEGTLNTNDQDFTCSYLYFSDGTSPRVLNMGSSNFTISYWDASSSGNLTINAVTSDLTIASSFAGGGFTYYNVTFDGVSVSINDSNTYNSMMITSGTILSIEAGTTQTTNDLQATGDCANLIDIHTSSDGITTTISQTTGTDNLDYVKITDIIATGGATFNATNSVDGGNNTGWSFSELTGTTYYWIGDGGNWSDPTHWSSTSGGLTNGCLPTPKDNVVFDVNSFSMLGQTVTVDDLDANCLSMNWTGATNMPELAVNRDLAIYGSLTLISGMTISFSGFIDLNFKSDNTGNALTTAGHSLSCYMHFDGSGEWTLQDDLIYATRIYLDKGSLVTNNFNISTTSFYMTKATTRQLTLGSSTITCSNQWNLFDETGLTLDAGTSTIIVNGSYTFYGADQTYYDVEMNSSQNIEILGSNTFNMLSVPNSTGVKFPQGSTQTLNSLSFPSGTCTAYNTISSDNPGFPATLSMSGIYNGDYLVISDVIATGAGSLNVGNSFGLGDVTGWNITSGSVQNFYWIGGNGSWNDTGHWSFTSGGPAGSCLPSLNDNVFFDANSFNTINQSVNMNGTAYCKSMDWSTATLTPRLAGSGKLNVNGSLQLIVDMSVTYSGSITLVSSQSGNTISTAGQELSSTINFDRSGEYGLIDDLVTSGTLNFRQGTFTTNDHDLTLDGNFNAVYSLPRTLNLGSAKITTGNWIIDATGLTFDAGTSQIHFQNYTNSFEGGGLIYYDVVVGSDFATLTGSNSFHFLTIEPGTSLTLDTSTTQTVTRLLVQGANAIDPIGLYSSVNGTTATISQATPNFCGDHLYLRDIVATGGASFFAGSNTTNLGGNSGWSFTDCSNPTVNAGVDAAVCLGETIILGGSPTAGGGTSPYTYSWNPSTGLNDGTSANPSATPTGNTTYIVTVTDNLGAWQTDTVMISVKSLPTPTASTSDAVICEGDSVQLSASGGISYVWSPSTNVNDAAIPNPKGSPPSTTTYSVIVTDAQDCSAEAQITVTVDSAVTANAGLDVVFCEGSSTTLNASGGTSYQWSPSTGLNNDAISGPVASPGSTTAYAVTVSRGECTSLDTILVTVNEVPAADAGVNQTLCFGDTLILGASATATGGTSPYTYFWTPANVLIDSTLANPIAFPLTTTTFMVIVADTNNCTNSDDVTVTVVSLPTVDVGSDDTVCVSESVTLGGTPVASGGTAPYTYSWSPAELVSNPTQANPVTSPVTTTEYVLTLTDFHGCSVVDTLVLSINEETPLARFTFNESDPKVYSFQNNSTDALTWSWDFGDGQTSTQKSPSHTFDGYDTYEVCLTAFNECKEQTSCETIEVLVSEPSNDHSGVFIYPNPVTDELVLSFAQIPSSDSQIVIHDMMGKTVYQTVIGTSDPNIMTIAVRDWKPDVYVIKVVTHETKTLGKIIIR